MSKNKQRQIKPSWPRRERLSEAVDCAWRFQQMCLLQMNLGNWATMDFPTRHHLNNILAIQFLEEHIAQSIYGGELAQRAADLIPSCKAYLAFIGPKR